MREPPLISATRLPPPFSPTPARACVQDADVDGVPPPTLVALEAYGEDTAGSLLLLTLEAAGVRADAADEAAALVGRALGLTTALRALPVHARLGQRYVPDELMRVHGLSVDDLLVAPDEVRGADGRSLAEIAAALGGGGSGADGVPQQQEQQPSSSAPASARASRIPRPPPAALGAAPVNLEQQARERDELRAAAQRRLQATKAAAWGDAAGATAGAPAAPAATSTRNGVAAADIDEPRTLRMAGSRATAVAAGAGAPSAAPVAGDGFTMGSGDRQPASASAAAASRVIVVGGGSSRYSGASSAASSSAATRDFGGAPGLDDTGAPAGGSSSGGGGKVTAEAGGFASSMNRLAMISEAKAARAAARAGDLAASAAPAAAVAPAPAPAPPAVTAASSASSPSVLNSLLGRPAAPPRLVLAKDPAPQARIRSAVADMAAAAEGRLAAARSLQPSLPPGAAAALLPAVPAARFLERLRADGHDVFAPGAYWRVAEGRRPLVASTRAFTRTHEHTRPLPCLHTPRTLQAPWVRGATRARWRGCGCSWRCCARRWVVGTEGCGGRYR